MHKILATAICVAALVATGASAASSWTPSTVAASLQRMTPLAGSGRTWIAHGFIKTPVCRASSPGFVCAATIQTGVSIAKVSLWVKPWSASRLCVSRTGQAVCAAPLEPADPRSCRQGTADACLIVRAAAAAQANHRSVVAITCAPAGPLKFTCTGDSVQAVSFAVSGGRWTTTVTP